MLWKNSDDYSKLAVKTFQTFFSKTNHTFHDIDYDFVYHWFTLDSVTFVLYFDRSVF